ncbi:MAG: ankyrin repeat domain-containing protein [Propionivibrio sp.]|uniref:Ankyrin repeat domain-containing protein n=1 Tax=Candidatus Propionivibrio dominans TaxID=2954373 RepID=A0A9D7FA22_9RHOO|nr:ankyrin repeat domain-containing protein [Candidatus Propionivibrio dominans]
MKIIAFLFALLLPALASAGAYEDMEEALIRGDSGAAINLIKRGVDVNTVDKAGNTLLIQAVRRDVPELFDYLLLRRAKLNVRNRNGETALSLAAYTGKLQYVQRLVEAGADVNFYGWSPLTYAAYNGHTAIVDYLLKRGAEINATTENGSSALFFAARFGHIEVIKLLLKNKADPTLANENGDTAIDWALKSDNTDIADLLRAAGGRSGKALVIDFSK